MIATIENEQGQQFHIDCQEIMGYWCQQAAEDFWGKQGWQTITVSVEGVIRERIVNPWRLQPCGS